MKTIGFYIVSLVGKVIIEFKEFLDKSCNPICLYVPDEESHLPELRILNRLRNEETHFFITDDDFLNDKEFETLYNLMIDLYPIFEKAYLFFTPRTYSSGLWGLGNFNNGRTEFYREPLRNFKYKSAIKNNALTEWIRNLPQPIFMDGFIDLPDIWTLVFLSVDEEKFKNDESVELLYACVHTLYKYQIIQFHYYAYDNFDRELFTEEEKAMAAEHSERIFTTFSISI